MHQPHNPPATLSDTLARIHPLQHHRLTRESTKTFWIEGIRQFMQAADAGFTFEAIIHSRLLLKSSMVRHAIARLTATGVSHLRVTPEQFRKISVTERASGIGAIVKQRWTPLHRADATRGLCWLVLESVRSAGNLGTVFRTAEATGVAGVIFLDHTADPYNLPVVRASMGGIFHLQLIRATHGHFRRWASFHRVRVLALTPRGQELWTTTKPPTASPPPPAVIKGAVIKGAMTGTIMTARLSAPLAVMIGEERQGLSDRALAMADERIRLPMSGRADSLNLGVAAGVMMYELVRRRLTAAPR
jgi:TrmH family RNA methyltransferase